MQEQRWNGDQSWHPTGCTEGQKEKAQETLLPGTRTLSQCLSAATCKTTSCSNLGSLVTLALSFLAFNAAVAFPVGQARTRESSPTGTGTSDGLGDEKNPGQAEVPHEEVVLAMR